MIFAHVFAVLAQIAPPPSLSSVRADSPPKIDAELDDEVWRRAPIYVLSWQQQPRPGASATLRAEVQFAHDNVALYAAVRCFDPEPELIPQRVTRRDRQIENDEVVLEIDSLADKKRAYVFAIYSSGVQRDALRTGDSAYDWDFDAVWSSATRLTSDGWNAEFAIPLSVLRFSTGPNVSFRVEVSRYVSRRGERDQLVLQPPSEQGALLRMARLDGLDDLEAGEGVELRPFVSWRLGRHLSPGPLYDPPSGTTTEISGGGELVWHPTSELTLDATVLPDFGQVEADQVVLNLTTYETFFPEKRPFFLLGADLFKIHDHLGNPTVTQLFYSRRLGRPPPTPFLGSGQRLLAEPHFIDILGAAKLSGNLSERVSVALLDALTRPESAVIMDSIEGAHRVPTVQLTNFGVGRLRVEVADGISIGGMAAVVAQPDSSPFSLVDCTKRGAPGEDRCTANALSGAVDATFSTSDGEYVAAAVALASHRFGGAARNLPDGTVVGPYDSGVGALAQVAKAAGTWTWFAKYEGYSPKLDLSDAGYLRQQNLHQLALGVDYRTLEPWMSILRSDLSFYTQARESTDFVNIGRIFLVSEDITWENLWNTYLELDLDPPQSDIRELRDGSIYDRPLFYGGVLAGHSDERRAFSVGGTFFAGNTLRGYILSSEVTFTLRPEERLDLSLTPRIDWSTGDPRWFSTSGAYAESHVYHLGDLDARAASLILRATHSFSPTLTLQAYAQAFLATGHYGPFYDASVAAGRAHVRIADLVSAAPPSSIANPDFKDGNLNINVVLRWEYLPGSSVYVVYAHGRIIGDLTPGLGPNRPDLRAVIRGPHDDILQLKLSFYYGS